MDVVKRVIGQNRDGEEHEEIPFISALLQNYDTEDKVRVEVQFMDYHIYSQNISLFGQILLNG